MQVNAALQHLQDSLPEDDAELSEEQEACLVGAAACKHCMRLDSCIVLGMQEALMLAAAATAL
jgi:hypothetical protein